MSYNSIITIDADRCVDTMTYDVLGNENVLPEYAQVFLIDTKSGEPAKETIIYALTDEDKSLLEEYAPKLFNTMLEPKKLLEVMIGFVRTVNIYKSTVRNNKRNKERYDSRQKVLINRSIDEKRDSFIKSIQNAIDLIGDEIFGPYVEDEYHPIKRGIEDPRNSLLRELHFALEDPTLYVKEIEYKAVNYKKYEKYRVSKQAIKDYLINLKLPNKTTEINNFITALS